MTPVEIKPLVCDQCGGQIDRKTMECPYCRTQYERKNNDVTLRYVVDRPGTHRLRAEIRVDEGMIAHDPERATSYVLDRLRREIADGLLAYMKISTSQDFSFHERCQIIRGEVRVIDPTFTDY
jgi:ribosomal protein L36